MSGLFPVGLVAYCDQRMTAVSEVLDEIVANQRECVEHLGATDALIARARWAFEGHAEGHGAVMMDVLALAIHRLAAVTTMLDNDGGPICPTG